MPRFTADAVVFAPLDHLCVLLVRRAADHDTEPGKLAIPGGHVDPGEEAIDAAYRELAEETGLDLRAHGAVLTWVGRFDEPGRDPRGDYVSDAFVTVLPAPVAVRGMDDAEDAEWLPVEQTLNANVAFDHVDIIRRALAAISTSTRS